MIWIVSETHKNIKHSTKWKSRKGIQGTDKTKSSNKVVYKKLNEYGSLVRVRVQN